MEAVDIGEGKAIPASESKADAAEMPKAKAARKPPAPGYVQIADVDRSAYVTALDMMCADAVAMCVDCYVYWMSTPGGADMMIQTHRTMALAFPNSIAKCWDCGKRLKVLLRS